MHFRRFACFLLGAWIVGSLFMTMVATQNFRSVDRLLTAPAAPAAKQIQKMGHEAARALLRYQVSEQNRWYFETWEWVQLGLGVLLFGILLFATDVGKFTLLTAALMVLLVVVARAYLTPEIIALGRSIDFQPPGMPSPERAKFWTFHNVYSGAELLKWGLGAILAVKLMMKRRRSSSSARDINLVDKANHRHVNR